MSLTPSRAALVILQIAGSLSVLAYPAVLLASVMALAAPGQSAVGAAVSILPAIYPLIWIVLYVISWRALSRGRALLAYGLSSVPVLASLVVAGLVMAGAMSFARSQAKSVADTREAIEPVNQLVWLIWSATGDRRSPPVPVVPVAQVLDAIEANPQLVNVGVPGYGSPLAVALASLPVDDAGSPIGDAGRLADLVRVVRALREKGATLGPGEDLNLRSQWRLEWALHDGPITTASENPLVWRILTRRRDGVTPFQLRADEAPLLNVETASHGTPLLAALLQDAPDAFRALVEAGAQLSPGEEQNPAATAALSRMLDRAPDLKHTYGRR